MLGIVLQAPGGHPASRRRPSDIGAPIPIIGPRLDPTGSGSAGCAVSWHRQLVAMIPVVEIRDVQRYRRSWSGWPALGLMPNEHTAGDREHQGALTRAGNTNTVGPWSKPPGTIGATQELGIPVVYPSSRIADSASGNQRCMSMSRYIATAIVTCSRASCRRPVR